MRNIKTSNIYWKISKIRIHIFENILYQISKGNDIDFTVNKYLKRIDKFRKNKDKFIELISYISKKDAKVSLAFYLLQDIEIRKNIFSVSKIIITDEIKNLVEFIYDKILFYPVFWKWIDDEEEFSKMIFKRKFFTEQWHCICPYCDLKEDLELLDFEIDHLLPKSEFPLLYINEMNLFPCCTWCNHTHHGKGNNRKDKYYNLFENTLGLKVKFEFDPEFRIIGIDDISNDFLDLIKIKNRTKTDIFSNKIDVLKNKIFKDLKSKNKVFIDEQSPFYFLNKAIYEYYSENMKKYLI